MNPIKRDSRAESSPPRLQFWQVFEAEVASFTLSMPHSLN
jgi:hypothetical protein